MTEGDKLIRDHFVTEYLIDFNAKNALMRAYATLGISRNDRLVTSQSYMMVREPYVVKQIQLAIDSIQEKNLISRNRILAGLIREANYDYVGASHAARVTAWSKLATIQKMDGKQVDLNVNGRNGVLVVPSVQKAEDWEMKAQEAQRILKAEVRK